MTDLERIELAARRASSRVGGETTSEGRALFSFADEVFRALKEKENEERKP